MCFGHKSSFSNISDPDFNCTRPGGSTEGSTRGPRGPKDIKDGQINGRRTESLPICPKLQGRRCLDNGLSSCTTTGKDNDNPPNLAVRAEQRLTRR